MNLPAGFSYSALYAGIRKVTQDDLALIFSTAPAAAAAVFTRNRVQAAPVRLARKHLESSGGEAQAILVNAGNANCATRTGDRVALACCQAAAKGLKVKTSRVLPASTGVIGVELDPALITTAMPRLIEGLAADRFEDVSRAILTTDTFAKTAFAEVAVKNGIVRIAGMTKGAGMIQPDMATTLGFVLTDAVVSPLVLRPMLRKAVDLSFNRLSVDGDTSTNDTMILLANGASGCYPKASDRQLFSEALQHLMQDLARQIAKDGEGSRKRITIEVSGATDEASASVIARAIANSPLVKTAIAGSDPNWGRILSAAGNSGVAFDPRKADIWLQDVKVCTSGLAADFSEPELKEKLNGNECVIRLNIRGGGPGRSRFWTCDLTEKYIEINASYRT